ncbi:MAG: cell division protein FtsQ/DivIB [Bdellovibrionales bacterium]
MRRPRSHNLRGSVRQNTSRGRARGPTLYGKLFRLGAILGLLILACLALLWSWHIGWPQQQAEKAAEAGLRLTQKAQFSIKDVVLEGRKQTSKDDIFDALGANSGAAILDFDPDAAQARIAKLPWVASVTVERRLPDRIIVHLTERVPMARWQHLSRTVIIDSEGKELPEAKLEQFSNLPLVVGPDAPEQTLELLEALKRYPAVEKVTTAAVRVGRRRWDLHLTRAVTARLPEENLDNGLRRLSALIADQKVLERNVMAIDLRQHDRLVIEPAPPARKSGDAKL